MHSSPLICAHADIKQNHSLAVSRAEASTCIYPPPTSSSQLPSQVIFLFPICIKRNNSTCSFLMVMAFYPTQRKSLAKMVSVTKLDGPLKTRPEVHQNFRINGTFPSALPTTWAVKKKTKLKSLPITAICSRKIKG